MKALDDFIQERSKTRQGQASILFFSLFVLSNRIATDVDKSLENLTLKQMLLLILIEIIGGGSYTELGQIMGSSRQNIKKLAVALEKKGFVQMTVDPKNAKASLVKSTGKSQEHFQELDNFYDCKLTQLFSAFTDEEVAYLFNLLAKAFQGLEEMEKSNALDTSHN